MLYQKLIEIKSNYKTYLGEKSLSRLKAYILGYEERQYKYDKNYRSFLRNFDTYAEEYFNIENLLGWEKIIEDFSKNDEDAFDNFYKLLEGYIKKDYTQSSGRTIKNDDRLKNPVISTDYVKREIKERHFTDHGNPGRFSNPHDHNVLYDIDGKMFFSSPINYPEEIF